MSERRPHASKPSKRSRTFGQGYEPGSVASTLTTAEMREFREWMKRHESDSRVFCKQLNPPDSR